MSAASGKDGNEHVEMVHAATRERQASRKRGEQRARRCNIKGMAGGDLARANGAIFVVDLPSTWPLLKHPPFYSDYCFRMLPGLFMFFCSETGSLSTARPRDGAGGSTSTHVGPKATYFGKTWIFRFLPFVCLFFCLLLGGKFRSSKHVDYGKTRADVDPPFLREPAQERSGRIAGRAVAMPPHKCSRACRSCRPAHVQ